MRGVGRATAAITVVNALPVGIGAAAGIALEATAELVVGEGGRGPETPVFHPAGASTPVVRRALDGACERYLPKRRGGLELRLASEIPVGRGLKSSSAVASAVALAVAHAAGADPSPAEIAALVAQVSREAGVSATGAFDDALAGLRPGIVVTDNRTDRLLREVALPSDVGVVLWIPPTEHPPSPALSERFAAEAPAAREAVRLVLEGNWAAAMERNSDLVERAMGYRYRELGAACRRRGALACGTSGLGPAFAAVVPETHLSSFATVFPRDVGETRTVRPASFLPAGSLEGR